MINRLIKQNQDLDHFSIIPGNGCVKEGNPNIFKEHLQKIISLKFKGWTCTFNNQNLSMKKISESKG